MTRGDEVPTYRLATGGGRGGAVTATEPGSSGRGRWRRWGVLLAVLLLVPAAGAVWWVGRGTVEAGSGADTPDAASTSWLYSLRYADEASSGRYVDSDAAGEVWRRWTADLADAGATLSVGSAPDGPAVTVDVDGDTATVTEWWKVQVPGDGVSYATGSRPWRIETVRRGDGWWITAVHPPPWCGEGGYVRC
ncbi:hypothetical protein [Salinispora arenicola]|uniref:hypothetical protein n=1 Tax=Salinispora arenicola TaxID=168697 RepID=UPI0012BD6386|nr:hypothetical protein [Salinispora arenicola]